MKYASTRADRARFAAPVIKSVAVKVLLVSGLLLPGLFAPGCALHNAFQDCPETQCPTGDADTRGGDASHPDVFPLPDADPASPDADVDDDTTSPGTPDVLDDTTPTPGPCDACPGGHCLDGQCVGIAQLVAGGNFTCALLDGAGAGRVACWGDNGHGQCGQRSNSTRTYVVEPTLVPGLEGVTELAAGQNHVCALGADGVRCWGNNTSYQLGHEEHGPIYEPMATTADLSDAIALSAGEGFTCALFPDAPAHSNVQCWGTNVLSQLGVDPSLHSTAEPQTLPWHDVKAAALGSGWNASCVLRQDGTVYCWGDNTYGQLGRGTDDEHGSVPVAMLSDAQSLALGQSAACALVAPESGKAVHCWGRGSLGQLGDGTTANRSDPREVEGLVNPQQVFGGFGTYFCALDEDGKLYCWGRVTYGQFGGSFTKHYVTPQPLDMLPDDTLEVRSLVAGIGHICALTTGDAIYCRGLNTSAQVGAPPAGENDRYTTARKVRIVVDVEDDE